MLTAHKQLYMCSLLTSSCICAHCSQASMHTVCVCVGVCVSVCLCVGVYVHVCPCVGVCMCQCVHVSECHCMCEREREREGCKIIGLALSQIGGWVGVAQFVYIHNLVDFTMMLIGSENQIGHNINLSR